MEEIDIIELLKRFKEGKAPQKIEINGRMYHYNDTWELKYAYAEKVNGIMVFYFENENITLNTKIKILDKPIIERLDYDDIPDMRVFRRKINEIIDVINKE